MQLHPYKTSGGKDLILEYINSLSNDEKLDGLSVIDYMTDDKIDELKIDHWRGSIYEVYFFRYNRIFYVTIEDKDIYLLHACRKQKNRTEKKDTDIIVKRAKELGKQLSKKFI
jgi:phage-related protein